MLDDRTQAAIRRHLAVPAAGIPNTSFSLGIQLWDVFAPPQQQAATVEARMQNLTPVEESYLTGRPTAQVVFTGIPGPGAALVLTAVTSDGYGEEIASYAMAPGDFQQPEPLLAMASNIVNLINLGNVPYIAALGPHGVGSVAVAQTASFTVAALQGQTFTLSLQPTGIGSYVATQGDAVDMTVMLDKVQIYGLVPILDALEARIAGASNFAAFAAAGVVKFDAIEDSKRQRVYERMRRRLAEFFGIGVDPLGLFAGRTGAIV